LAIASSVGGIVRPSVFAVFRLITSSNLVDCTTGRSAGFPPVFGALTWSDQDFAESLCEQFDRQGLPDRATVAGLMRWRRAGDGAWACEALPRC